MKRNQLLPKTHPALRIINQYNDTYVRKKKFNHNDGKKPQTLDAPIVLESVSVKDYEIVTEAEDSMEADDSNLINDKSFQGFIEILDKTSTEYFFKDLGSPVKEEILNSIKSGKKLPAKHHQSIIRCLNLQVNKFLGSIKPDKTVWKSMAELLSRKF